MKKLVLTIVALVAVATTSFAQYFTTYKPCPSVTYNVPNVTYTVPKVTYSVPSTVNYNTTSVTGYSRSNGTYVPSHEALKQLKAYMEKNGKEVLDDEE